MYCNQQQRQAHPRDGRREGGLAVVDVPNGAYGEVLLAVAAHIIGRYRRHCCSSRRGHGQTGWVERQLPALPVLCRPETQQHMSFLPNNPSTVKVSEEAFRSSVRQTLEDVYELGIYLMRRDALWATLIPLCRWKRADDRALGQGSCEAHAVQEAGRAAIRIQSSRSEETADTAHLSTLSQVSYRSAPQLSHTHVCLPPLMWLSKGIQTMI